MKINTIFNVEVYDVDNNVYTFDCQTVTEFLGRDGAAYLTFINRPDAPLEVSPVVALAPISQREITQVIVRADDEIILTFKEYHHLEEASLNLDPTHVAYSQQEIKPEYTIRLVQ